MKVILCFSSLVLSICWAVGCKSTGPSDEVEERTSPPKPSQDTEENTGYFLSCNRMKTVEKNGKSVGSLGCGFYDNQTQKKSDAGKDADWDLKSDDDSGLDVDVDIKNDDSIYHVVFTVTGNDKESVNSFIDGGEVEVEIEGKPASVVEVTKVKEEPFKVFSLAYPDFRPCPLDTWQVLEEDLKNKAFFKNQVAPLLPKSQGFVWSWVGNTTNPKVDNNPLIANAAKYNDQEGFMAAKVWEFRRVVIHDQIKNQLIKLTNKDYLDQIAYQVCSLEEDIKSLYQKSGG